MTAPRDPAADPAAELDDLNARIAREAAAVTTAEARNAAKNPAPAPKGTKGA